MPEAWLVRVARHIGLEQHAYRTVQRYRRWKWTR